MRYLPLLPSDRDPAAWPGTGEAELRWMGAVRGGWRAKTIHTLHLAEGGADALLEQAQGALAAGLGPDFLVIPISAAPSRREGFALLGALETLLQVAQGRLKVALRLQPQAMVPVLNLLRDAKGEAVGFCWQPGLDPEPIADRLWCAVAGPDADLAPLQRVGYRWNVALEAEDETTFRAWSEALQRRFPAALFPAEPPAAALGRPIPEDPDLRFGASWGKP